MTDLDVHFCPRCELRFVFLAELRDHLDNDHGLVFDASQQPASDPAVTAATLSGRIVLPVDPARVPTIALGVGAIVAHQASMEIDIVATTLPGLATVATDAFLYKRAVEANQAGAPRAVHHDLGFGNAADKLIDYVRATPPVMVCMATRARGAISQMLLGSVSEAVVRHSPVPVLLAGPVARVPEAGYTRVVAALDGSPLAERSLDAAADLAARLGVELSLLEVLDQDGLPPDVVESAYLQRQVRRLDLAGTVSFDTLHSAHPAQALLDALGDDSSTIVAMGTHGRTGLRRLAMGSVALDVVRRAAGPVLVTPATVLETT